MQPNPRSARRSTSKEGSGRIYAVALRRNDGEGSLLRISNGLMIAICCAGTVGTAASARNLQVTASTSLVYDDNIFRTTDGVTRGNGRSDQILSPTISVQYGRPVGPVSLAVGSDISYDFHRRNTQLNRERLGLNASAQTKLAGCAVSLEGNYRRGQSDLADLVGVGNIVNVEDAYMIGTNILCGDDFGLRPGLGYSRSVRTNSTVGRSISDVKSDSYTASIGYSLPSFGLLSLYGRIYDGSYPNRPPLGPGLPANDAVRVYSGGITYNRAVGTRLMATVSVGYQKVKPALSQIRSSSGLTYSGNISYRGSNRLSGSLGFSRSAEQSNLLDVSYAIIQRYNLGINYALTERISLNAGAVYSERSFEESAALPGSLARGTDKTKRISGGISLAAVRALKFSLSAYHEERDSGVALFNYDSNRVTLTAGLSF